MYLLDHTQRVYDHITFRSHREFIKINLPTHTQRVINKITSRSQAESYKQNISDHTQRALAGIRPSAWTRWESVNGTEDQVHSYTRVLKSMIRLSNQNDLTQSMLRLEVESWRRESSRFILQAHIQLFLS